MKMSCEPGSWVPALEESGTFFHCIHKFCHMSGVSWVLALLLAGFVGCPQRAQAQQKVAVSQVPAAVKNGKAQLLGPYDPGQKLRLVFGLQPPHLQEEEEFLRQLQDRDSPLFQIS
jgi:hypothetical protein